MGEWLAHLHEHYQGRALYSKEKENPRHIPGVRGHIIAGGGFVYKEPMEAFNAAMARA
jgi:hypothetical protein